MDRSLIAVIDEWRQTGTAMPIRIDALDEDGPVPVKPGTNAHELLTVLSQHPDLGFTGSELAELTDVPAASVGKTLSRLQSDGLVRNVEGYWAVAEDFEVELVSNVVSLSDLEGHDGPED